jgi:hypothetical protein
MRGMRAVLGTVAVLALAAGCGQQPERRAAEGERGTRSGDPTYRSETRYGDIGPDAPSGGVKSGQPTANNPPSGSR